MRWVAAIVLVVTGLSGCASGHSAQPRTGERITYLIEDDSVSPPAYTTTVVDIARPYLARTMVYSGSDASGSILNGFIWTENALYDVSTTGEIQQTQVIAPEPAPPATRLDVALPLALEQKLVVQVGTGSVIGRACTMWSSKEPLDSLEIDPPTATDHTTSCVDAQGHLLSEVWTLDSKVARKRTATSIDATKALTDATVLTVSPTPVPAGVSEEAVADIPVDNQGFGVSLAPPSGFALDRAVRIQRSIGGDPVPVVARIGEVDAYRSGSDLILLRRTKDVVGSSIPAQRGAVVSVGALGTGRLDPISTGCRITVLTSGGVLVVATSTGSPDVLLGWLRTATIR